MAVETTIVGDTVFTCTSVDWYSMHGFSSDDPLPPIEGVLAHRS
jgi:hypothetical protein